MNRNIAIILTIVTVLCCGCPGLYSLGNFVFSFFYVSPDTTRALAGSGLDPATVLLMSRLLVLCGGLLGLVIPLAVGFVSFRMAKK